MATKFFRLASGFSRSAFSLVSGLILLVSPSLGLAARPWPDRGDRLSRRERKALPGGGAAESRRGLFLPDDIAREYRARRRAF